MAKFPADYIRDLHLRLLSVGNKRKVSTILSTFLPCDQDSSVNEHPDTTMVTEEHSESIDLVNPEAARDD